MGNSAFDVFGGSDNLWWDRFWNPGQTLSIFGENKLVKIEYFKRVLV